MKIIYNKAISKNGNISGKTTIEKIESCNNCHWKDTWECLLTKKRLNEDNSIPKWCPLEDYNE